MAGIMMVMVILMGCGALDWGCREEDGDLGGYGWWEMVITSVGGYVGSQ